MSLDNGPTQHAPLLVYYSSKSGNTARFVTALGLPALRLPEALGDPVLVEAPFVLICPTYADGEGKGAVPKQVIHFLNNPENRGQLLGVIGAGNRNFGETYALSGRIISKKCNVPLLYSFELAGTKTDISLVREGLQKLGEEQCSTTVC